MSKLLVASSLLALLAACNSPSDEPADDQVAADPAVTAPAASTAPQPLESPAPAAVPETSVSGVDPASLRKGDMVEVVTLAECYEVGPNADDSPWDMYPGVVKEVLAVEDDKVRVRVGDTECLLPASNVKKT